VLVTLSTNKGDDIEESMVKTVDCGDGIAEGFECNRCFTGHLCPKQNNLLKAMNSLHSTI
jgi:hypothetical protein